MSVGELVRLCDDFGSSTTVVWSSIYMNDDPRIVGKLKWGEFAIVLEKHDVSGYIRAVGPHWVGWIYSTHVTSVI
jgi:hypothetical protein